MILQKKSPRRQHLTPMKICLMTIFCLASALFWQNAVIKRNDHTIAGLLSENADLKKNLYLIDGKLSELRDTESDVRIFQRELVKVIKDIDESYPVSFASKSHTKSIHPIDDSFGCDVQEVAQNASESIFKLASSQQGLRFETASLLGRAISIRDILAKTPSMIPVNGGYISSSFGSRRDPFTNQIKKHHGVDIAAPVGTLVVASADGPVLTAAKNSDLGNLIEIQHADGYTTRYGHLSEIFVKKGQIVKRGQVIGSVGNTGLRCSGSHLHFEVSKNGVRQDPKPFMLSSPPTFS